MTTEQEPFERIDATRAKELIDGGNVALIDVREQDEWDEGYIASAALISVNDIINLSRVEDIPKDRPIVFYCAAGVRSALAAELAAAVGTPGPLYNLEGGMDAWRSASFPVAQD